MRLTVTTGGGPAAGALLAAVWIGVAISGGTDAGFRVTPLAAAAAAGVAVLAGWLPLPDERAGAARFGLSVLALPLATAAAAGGEPLVPLCAVALAVALLDGPSWECPHALAGAVGLALATALLGRASGDWSLPAAAGDGVGVAAAVLLAAALTLIVGVAGAGDEDRPGARLTLLVPALVAGLAAAPVLAAATGMIAAGALATVVAWRGGRPAAVLGLTAVAVAAAGPGLRPAAVLLAAAAVLAAAIDLPGTAVLGVPGAIAAVVAVDTLMTAETAGAAAVLAVVAATAVLRTDWAAVAEALAGPPTEQDLPRALPLALAVWLVVAPGSWGIAGAAGLRPYDRGALVALASGLAAVALAGAWSHLPSVRFGPRRQ